MKTLRGQCPQCQFPLTWKRRLWMLLAWWSEWRCERCGAWVEVRFPNQMALMYGVIPAAVVLFFLRHFRWVHTPWTGLALVAIWVWLTSRLTVTQWSSTHCSGCGYPLPPLKDFPRPLARVCPECGRTD